MNWHLRVPCSSHLDDLVLRSPPSSIREFYDSPAQAVFEPLEVAAPSSFESPESRRPASLGDRGERFLRGFVVVAKLAA